MICYKNCIWRGSKAGEDCEILINPPVCEFFKSTENDSIPLDEPVKPANGEKFITEARISNNCIAIHGEEKAFDIAMTHIKNNYKMFLNTKKVIVIKMELR